MLIGIVGLGLIGGSMARAIKTKTAHTVWGADTDEETMLLARLSGAIDGALTDEKLGACDIVMLALRPGAAVDWAEKSAAGMHGGAVLIDLCGVKRAVSPQLSAAAEKHGLSYVGGHPMAGKERGRFVNSTPELFDGASMILTPNAATRPQTLELLEKLFADVGFGGVVYTKPEEHDRIIAYTSQLAHIVSSAYVKSPEAQRQRGFSAGSFKDMTRVACLDEEMWTELFMDNADFLTEQLELLSENLRGYAAALKGRDGAALKALLKDGREKKAQAGGS